MSDDGRDRLVAAEQDERRRIALFLHDGPVQNLSGIALMLDAALHAIETGKLEDARDVLSSALDRQRSTIRELRDQGFGPAIEALAEQIGTSNQIRIDLDVGDSERVGGTAQVALYTIVRELLDQAVKRGPLTRIEIGMKALDGGGIETFVADDAEPERRRRSLEGIEERVKQLHGSITVDAEEPGTRVVVTLPPYATRR